MRIRPFSVGCLAACLMAAEQPRAANASYESLVPAFVKIYEAAQTNFFFLRGKLSDEAVIGNTVRWQPSVRVPGASCKLESHGKDTEYVKGMGIEVTPATFECRFPAAASHPQAHKKFEMIVKALRDATGSQMIAKRDPKKYTAFLSLVLDSVPQVLCDVYAAESSGLEPKMELQVVSQNGQGHTIFLTFSRDAHVKRPSH